MAAQVKMFHVEHLNKEAKQCLASNITDEAVLRVGKSIGFTVPILKQFDKVNEIKEVSCRHSKCSTKGDMEIRFRVGDH